MKTQHDVLMSDPEFRKLLAVESLAAAAEIIAQMMADQGLSKADLARRLNKSRSWVTQLLSGGRNMTVRTLAEVVHARGGESRTSG
jgi:antitoxin component HigA of HigAB toxin-antitoxin module